jgi:hypothetical protein
MTIHSISTHRSQLYIQIFDRDLVNVVPILFLGKAFVASFCVSARKLCKQQRTDNNNNNNDDRISKLERLSVALEDWEYLSLLLDDEPYVSQLLHRFENPLSMSSSSTLVSPAQSTSSLSAPTTSVLSPSLTQTHQQPQQQPPPQAFDSSSTESLSPQSSEPPSPFFSPRQSRLDAVPEELSEQALMALQQLSLSSSRTDVRSRSSMNVQDFTAIASVLQCMTWRELEQMRNAPALAVVLQFRERWFHKYFSWFSTILDVVMNNRIQE